MADYAISGTRRTETDETDETDETGCSGVTEGPGRDEKPSQVSDDRVAAAGSDLTLTNPRGHPDGRSEIAASGVIGEIVEELSRLFLPVAPTGPTDDSGQAPPEPRRAGWDRMTRLNRRLIEAGGPPEILAAATGAGLAMFSTTAPLDADLVEVTVLAARVLASEDDHGLQVLGGLALAAMAAAGWDHTETADLLLAAETLRRCEQLAAAARTIKLALSRSSALATEDAVRTHLIAARLPGTNRNLDGARAAASSLPPDAVAWAWIRSVEQAESSRVDGLAAALAEGRAPDAAAIYLREITDAGLDHTIPLVTGFAGFVTLMTRPDPDATSMRRSLLEILRHIRHVQRLDEYATAARTAVDAAVEILLASTTVQATNVLAEFLEGLADAGLGELAPDQVRRMLTTHPSMSTSQLRRAAQTETLWPDMAAAMAGLDPASQALILHPMHGSNGPDTWITAAQYKPPGGFSAQRSRLSPAHHALISACERGDPTGLAALTRNDIDDLVRAVFPTTLLADLNDQAVETLLIVPTRSMWTVPWASSTLLSQVRVAVAPSLAVHASASDSAPIRSITLLADQDIDGAWPIIDALRTLRSTTDLSVRIARDLDDAETCDLLIVYGHGSGSGLGFTMSAGGPPITAATLATAPAAQIIVASCWSGTTPAASVPVNLPILALLAGRVGAVGGLWPLPATATGHQIARLAAHVANGATLTEALRLTRPHGSPFQTGGLAAFS